jgi:signal transduction histidine kinase
LLSLQKKKEAGSQGHAGESIVRAAFHALWLRGLRTPAPWRYGVGVFAALAASLARIALNPYWGTSFPYILFFPTTLFTALFAGLGPAWVGIVISAVMTLAWILPPTGVDHIYLVGLTTYVVVDGAIAWIGSAHRALTEQSERQTADLEAREQDLKRAVVEAETANQAKDDFLAVLSHELRTPLTTIVAGVRVLHHIGSPEESASRTRESIERQADHLVRLVDDLLDMKRIVSGAVALELRPCDLGDAVADVIAVLNDAGRFKAHVLSLDTEPVWVNGDVTRLQQITTNLLGNALKYTPPGGSIHVSVKREGDDAVLRVRDSGIGISPDLPPRMFDLFVQGDPGSERVRSGLGIGLAVVRRLVELHGGTVQASSDGPGRGSTFTVRLPRIPTASA